MASNLITKITLNGTPYTLSDSAFASFIEGNDSSFATFKAFVDDTTTKLEDRFTKAEINETVTSLEKKISQIPVFEIKVLTKTEFEDLQKPDNAGDISFSTVYVVKSDAYDDDHKHNNLFTEYIAIQNAETKAFERFEELGTQSLEINLESIETRLADVEKLATAAATKTELGDSKTALEKSINDAKDELTGAITTAKSEAIETAGTNADTKDTAVKNAARAFKIINGNQVTTYQPYGVENDTDAVTFTLPTSMKTTGALSFVQMDNSTVKETFDGSEGKKIIVPTISYDESTSTLIIS